VSHRVEIYNMTYNFDQVNKFCISHGSAVTNSGEVDNCVTTSVNFFFLRILRTKIIKIGSFLTDL